MLRHGEEWGTPCAEPPDQTLTATDAELARTLPASSGSLVHWIPAGQTDLGRAIGRASGVPSDCATVAPMDTLRLATGERAVNAVVVGARPHRWRWWTRSHVVDVRVDDRAFFSGPALCVVIANGEYVDGLPLLPRAHPGDGALDIAVIAVPASERRELRHRAARGEHLPHPAIRTARGKSVTVTSAAALPVVQDGVRRSATQTITIDLESDSWRCFL